MKNLSFDVKKMGGGRWLIDEQKSGTHIMKIIPGGAKNNLLIKQILLRGAFALGGLCRHVEDWWECGEDGIMIYPTGSTRCEAPTFDEKFIQESLEMIGKVHSLGLYHGHPDVSQFRRDEDGKLFFDKVEDGGFLSETSVEFRKARLENDYLIFKTSLTNPSLTFEF